MEGTDIIETFSPTKDKQSGLTIENKENTLENNDHQHIHELPNKKVRKQANINEEIEMNYSSTSGKIFNVIENQHK